jgi:hypothetical protein
MPGRKKTPVTPQVFETSLPATGCRTASENVGQVPLAADKPVEIGGRDGPDPVRYGDWERNGRCIDF